MLFGKHVNKYYLKYAVLFIIGIVALIAVDYFQLILPEIFGGIIDGLDEATLTKSELNKFIIQMGGIALIMFSGRFLWRYCIFGAGVRIEADIREEMFKHSEKLSHSYYKEHKTGGLMALFTNDLQTIRMTFGQGTIMFIDAVFLGALAFIRMFQLKKELAFAALIPMALIAFLAAVVGKSMKMKFKERQEAYEELSDFSQENFSGISVIKAFVKETFEIRAFGKVNKKNYDKNMKFAKFSTLVNVLISAIVTSIAVILLIGCGYYVINDPEFTIGNLSEYIAYFSALTWPMMAVGQLINMRSQAKASYTRVANLLEAPVEIVDKDNAAAINEIEGKIEFKNLNFAYPDGFDNVLRNVSFTINKGEMVGIIGKTGCGKTTIVDLLLRIYNVEENTILLDDIDIMNIPFKKVREGIGYVPQDNFLFSDTIKNNIAFAYEDITDDKIKEAALLADVHNNIIGFENQYQTILGERGVTLSGGQKQRVSIARAIIKNPAILIFDDSVSAVDTKTEETILNNLKRLRRDKTTILIAHRISTVKDLDKIIVLDDGEIVGIGDHTSLIQTSPLYKEMVRLQSLESEINGGEDNE